MKPQDLKAHRVSGTDSTRDQSGALCSLKLHLSPFDMHFETIGGVPPSAGICGSAYIDHLALP